MRNVFRKNKYDELLAKVEQVRGLNLPPDKWTQAQLKIMVRWSKRDGDEKISSRKQDQLTRYYETCHHEDLLPPEIPLPLQQIKENIPTSVEPLPKVDDLLLDNVLDDDNQIHKLELAEILAGHFQNEELLRDAIVVEPTAV